MKISLLLASSVAGYLAPRPMGKSNVTLTTGPLIDHTRRDPYAPKPTPRALMLSVFQPAQCVHTVPAQYMPNKTAAYQGPFLEQLFNISVNISPLFLEARLPVCITDIERCSTLDDAPILLFSPGYRVNRFYYNYLASAIASEGFTVITIDHPYDANIITYPDGDAVYTNFSILETPSWDLITRAEDASFVIEQLSNATAMAELIPSRGLRPFPVDRVAMFGHSAGGGAAVVAASRDSRIRSAVNWDGPILGSLSLSGMSQPALFIAREDVTYDNWPRAWSQLQGPKLAFRIANTTHQSFSDAPTLFRAAGQDLKLFADLLGTIPPEEMVRLLTCYTIEWARGSFKERASDWLPETINSCNASGTLPYEME
ncbi:hypothetical protein KC343_g6781 [Hortaea werneckii]|uniref:1-alkyl-2-acetylglycerophosphocholine esterase n=1 Tax=Hortaea werneckii TaxID=91943 RepID=A0A3M7H770_HORWE|nr:hypothetical protein KC338_g2998 [Hortaea werneckii]KAI6873538.1 hypothetical protein KC323_g1123 [Hortaea werneckii]KAI7237801.1 hypothetical protein KC352_g14930 [Hortaea werneckii]KAI7355807.1 hypothetical protein KC320_g2666 [Hortaea werneckii]KAI7564909.1 hypothetical protein KC317_g6732 [Hortaea werneckii]